MSVPRQWLPWDEAPNPLAGSLQDQSPAVAAYVRSTGQRIDRLADDLRDKPAGELLAMATDFGRRQPLALLAGAAIIGFALARVVKAGIGAPGSEPGPGSRTATRAASTSGARHDAARQARHRQPCN